MFSTGPDTRVSCTAPSSTENRRVICSALYLRAPLAPYLPMPGMPYSCIMDTGLLRLESSMDAGIVDYWTLAVYPKSLQHSTELPDKDRKHSVLYSKYPCPVNRETRLNLVIV